MNLISWSSIGELALQAVIIAAALFVMGWLLYLFFLRRRVTLQSVSLNLPFGLGSATFAASSTDRAIAWSTYVHLQTRKAALPFDDEHDVVAEVFDSLYELFPVIRDLLTQLPVSELERSDGIADVLLRVQNDGLRPILTKWQASFRRWWKHALDDPEHADRAPQAIQRDFPGYDDLVADIRVMNAELSKYSDELVKLARGEAAPVVKEIEPVAPSQPN